MLNYINFYKYHRCQTQNIFGLYCVFALYVLFDLYHKKAFVCSKEW